MKRIICASLALLCAATAWTQTNTYTDTVQQPVVQRLGLNYARNVAGNTPYDKNLLDGGNAGCEPILVNEMWQVTSGTASTFTGTDGYAHAPANFYSDVFPAIYTVRYSASGASAGRTGHITANTANSGSSITFTAAGNAAGQDFAQNDYIQVHQLRYPSPLGELGGNNRGNLISSSTNGATLSGDWDVSTMTQGIQSCHIDTSASTSANLTLQFGFNTGGSVLMETGQTYEICALTHQLSGSPAVKWNVSSVNYGTVASGTFAPATSWGKQCATFTGNETPTTFNGTAQTAPTYIGGHHVTFSVGGGQVVNLDDVSLIQTSGQDATNTTPYRDSFVNEFVKPLKPGSLRLLDWNFYGVHMSDWIKSDVRGMPVIQSGLGGVYPGSDNTSTRVVGGLPYSLQLCLAANADCVLPYPWQTDATGGALLQEYLGGDANTVGGAIRIAEGFPNWITTFKNAGLQMWFQPSNENWNDNSQGAGNIWSAEVGYPQSSFVPLGTVTEQVVSAMKKESTWDGKVVHFGIGIQLGDNYYIGQTMAACPDCDYLAEAPYSMQWYNTNFSAGPLPRPQDLSARAEATISATTPNSTSPSWGGMASSVAQAPNMHFSIYEWNNSTNPCSGVITSQDMMKGYADGEGYGLWNTQQGLSSEHSLGTYPLTLFTDAQYQFSGSCGRTNWIWGVMNGFGVNSVTGPNSNNYRPTYYAMQLVNNCVLPTELQTSWTGMPTWDFTSMNSVPSASNLPLLNSFVYSDGGTKRCAVYYNDDEKAHNITIAGTDAPSGTVTVGSYYSANLNDDNETTVNVPAPAYKSVNWTGSMSLNPHSITTIAYTTGGQ